MRGLQVLSVVLSIVVTISSEASVTESVGISDIMSAAYQLKARMEMRKLEGMAFQARTLAKLQKIQADLELRKEMEKLEIERVRALAPRGIRGAPGPAGMLGEPGETGLRGLQGARGEDGQDGRVPNEASLLQEINDIRALAQLNRNYLDQLVLSIATDNVNCSRMILLDGKETIEFSNYYLLPSSCSWVVWSLHGGSMQMKITLPHDAKYSLAVGGSTVNVPVGSWIAISSPYALIHYSSHTAHSEPATLVFEETQILSVSSRNKLLPTNSFVYSEPFALTYPLPPATQYRNNERTFIIGRAMCGDKATLVTIYDVGLESGYDWIETTWFDASVTPPRFHSSGRITGSSGKAIVIPPSTSFLSLFHTDGGGLVKGFKLRADCGY